MKKKFWLCPLIALGFVLILTNGCKKDDDKNQIETGTVTDIEGNVYKTVKIGNQWWMAENLKTTKYRNGEPIPNITDSTLWKNLASGAYCDYDNSPSNRLIYGNLYNWYAVNDNRSIAPVGWHVPADAEWSELIAYLGGEDVAGGKLKENGSTHWQSPNVGATNETDFTALPGGCRDYDGLFYDIGSNGFWWSSTEDNIFNSWYRYIFNIYAYVARYRYDKTNGFSVRCVRD
jgi:uncharacterized protein (TIGR02145 family)